MADQPIDARALQLERERPEQCALADGKTHGVDLKGFLGVHCDQYHLQGSCLQA
ncbi:hypothetical protein ACVDG8_021280 [Mesorhizobium sp. ORM8.1]